MESWAETLNEYGVHLEQLRKKLLRVVKLFAVLFIIGFFLVTPGVKWAITHISLPGVTIATTSPFQFFDMIMSGAFLFATLITVPILGIACYRFLKPALLPSERKLFIRLIPLMVVLFLVGFAYGLGVLSFAIVMIAQVNTDIGIANIWDIGKFVSEIMVTAVLLGLVFQFPIVLTGMMRLGFLTVDFLRSKRRHAVVAIFVFVSLLPPTDGISLVLMAVPMILIYEVTIFINSSRRR